MLHTGHMRNRMRQPWKITCFSCLEKPLGPSRNLTSGTHFPRSDQAVKTCFGHIHSTSSIPPTPHASLESMQSMPSTLPTCTLPPIIMEVENSPFGDKPHIFQGPIFHFHDYGRKSMPLKEVSSFQKLGRRSSSRRPSRPSRNERRRSERRRDSRHLAHEVGVGLRLPQPSNNSKFYRHCMHINTYVFLLFFIGYSRYDHHVHSDEFFFQWHDPRSQLKQERSDYFLAWPMNQIKWLSGPRW